MDEESRVIEALTSATPYPMDFDDDLHRRLMGALNHPASSALDVAVLVRQLLRRWSLRDNRSVPVDLNAEVSEQIRPVRELAGLNEISTSRWTATVWAPQWLNPDGAACDVAALAGTEAGRRFHEDPLMADPFFVNLTGFKEYRTAGQRAACRAAMSSPEGATLICMLPTGSGKTEIALALSARRKYGVTVIVVPTLALAYDFERRFRDHYVKLNEKVKPETLHFAWTSKTSDTVKEQMRNGILQGQQPILVTSPESLTKSLRLAMMSAAEIGRLQGFVIDEAHLVTQWGRAFRPEFRTLADLRRDLLQRAVDNGHERAITLLLSATLGPAEMNDLTELFSEPGPCTPIVANALRSETDIWIARSDAKEPRTERVLEALAHVPRPAILYLTSPDNADEWCARLREQGYRRIASVTGRTLAEERSRVLEHLRAGATDGEGIDLVVATSAFGLGIDYPHIRSILHACLPETVDRWYQEMGRGGRDGNACGEYLLTAPADTREAESLGVRVLTPLVARDRWRDLWDNRKVVDDGFFLDLEGSRGVARGDYNRRWNAQLVQGLVELGHLRRQLVDVDDLRELVDETTETIADWTEVELTSAKLGTDTFWNDEWGPWQREESGRSRDAVTRIVEVSRSRIPACHGIANAYAPGPDLEQIWGDSLQWMEPLIPCGRCPGCRAEGARVNLDPPPRPKQKWAVAEPVPAELTAFVAAARGQHGVAVLSEKAGEDLGTELASALVARGVRHVAGEFGTLAAPPSGTVLFRDALPLSPRDLTPVSSFSRFAPGDAISRFWLSRRASPRWDGFGNAIVDVLLVPEGATIGGKEIGREIRTIPSRTALEILGRS